MKRKVTLTFEIDPNEYHEAGDTPQGAIDLAKDMILGRADLPNEIKIFCEDEEDDLVLEDENFKEVIND